MDGWREGDMDVLSLIYMDVDEDEEDHHLVIKSQSWMLFQLDAAFSLKKIHLVAKLASTTAILTTFRT